MDSDHEVINEYGDTNVVDFDSTKYDQNFKGKKHVPLLRRWYFWVLLILALGGIGTGGYFFLRYYYSDEQVALRKVIRVGLNEKFSFDDFDITLSSKITFVPISHYSSKNNGGTAAVIPITITNNSDSNKTLSTSDMSFLGTEGETLEDINQFYADKNSISFNSSVKPGESITRNLFVVYSKDGEYTIMMRKKGYQTHIVKFNINKK